MFLSLIYKITKGECSLVAWQVRTQHCHCCCLDYCCGSGSIPGPGTSRCCGHCQKKKKKSLRDRCTTFIFVFNTTLESIYLTNYLFLQFSFHLIFCAPAIDKVKGDQICGDLLISLFQTLVICQ